MCAIESCNPPGQSLVSVSSLLSNRDQMDVQPKSCPVVSKRITIHVTKLPVSFPFKPVSEEFTALFPGTFLLFLWLSTLESAKQHVDSASKYKQFCFIYMTLTTPSNFVLSVFV